MVVIGVNGNEVELSTPEIVTWFRELEQENPFELRGCRFDMVDIVFTDPIKDPVGLISVLNVLLLSKGVRGRPFFVGRRVSLE